MKTTYYYLPLDNFGQPIGTIEEIKLTIEEYQAYHTNVHSNYYYIYECYADALHRAQD